MLGTWEWLLNRPLGTEGQVPGGVGWWDVPAPRGNLAGEGPVGPGAVWGEAPPPLPPAGDANPGATLREMLRQGDYGHTGQFDPFPYPLDTDIARQPGTIPMQPGFFRRPGPFGGGGAVGALPDLLQSLPPDVQQGINQGGTDLMNWLMDQWRLMPPPFYFPGTR